MLVDKKDIFLVISDIFLWIFLAKFAPRNTKIDEKDFIELSQNVYGFILGDFNGDGEISIRDLTELSRFLNNPENELSEEERRKFDLNFDGVVNNEDLLILQLLGIYF